MGWVKRFPCMVQTRLQTDLDKGLWLHISGKQWADGGGNHVVSATGVPAGEGRCCSSSECVSISICFLREGSEVLHLDFLVTTTQEDQEEWLGIAELAETHCFWGAPHATWKSEVIVVTAK